MIVYEKEYTGESIVDMDRDLSEVFNESFNPLMSALPVDENGILLGNFKVTINWTNDDEVF